MFLVWVPDFFADTKFIAKVKGKITWKDTALLNLLDIFRIVHIIWFIWQYQNYPWVISNATLDIFDTEFLKFTHPGSVVFTAYKGQY